MVLIREYRVLMPTTVPEYQVAQLYCVAKMSKQETGVGAGVEVLKNEPYTRGTESGQYTHKIYHLGDRIPKWISSLLPKDALKLEEKAWNAYPICGTYLSSPWATSVKIAVETIHKADRGETENIHNLPPEKLKVRQVVYVDIANDKINPKKYKKEDDPTIFSSKKSGRGPLVKDWTKTTEPIMCCYKLITVDINKAIIGPKLERYIQEYEYELMLHFHRQVFCTIDEWFGMTIEDIRKIEDATAKELLAKINQEAPPDAFVPDDNEKSKEELK